MVIRVLITTITVTTSLRTIINSTRSLITTAIQTSRVRPNPSCRRSGWAESQAARFYALQIKSKWVLGAKCRVAKRCFVQIGFGQNSTISQQRRAPEQTVGQPY